MKNQWFLLSLLATFLSFISCSKDDPFPTDEEDDMSFVHSVTVGDNAYVSLFKDLNVEQTSTQNSLVFAKESFLFTYGGNIYVLESMNARLYKYRVENGLLIQEKETMILPSGSLPAFLTFDSEEKAYISCVGLGKLYIINPTTMQKTGEIDLSEYAIGKESGDKNPEPGASVIRDGILYVGLAQDKSQFNPNTGAYVLLIDTKTDKPIKMISDNRATMATAYEYSGDPFIDEKGDLYIYCVGGFGYFANCTEGFLRIKKGETDFDQSYYFPIETISIPDIKGNKANYIHSKTYTGNGKLYGYFNVPGYVSNPPDYVNDKSMQTFEIDVYNKTVKKMNFDGTTGWSCSQCKVGDYMVFGMASTQGTGYYLYNYKEDKYEPLKIKTEGNPFKIQYLK